MSQAPSKGTKDFKLVTFKVVTLDQVLKNERLMTLLYLISKFKELNEKTVYHLVHEVQEKGLNLGYNFFIVGGHPNSKQLKDDLVALMYVDLIEADPRTKKLRLTGQGLDVIEKYSSEMSPDKKSLIDNIVEEVKKKILVLDNEVDLELALKKGRRRGRRF
ncbi:MAG: hypothetical protein GSR82_00970 [Desulfurococcales archaeon]|nr:hypothetical protein [Desulfurococcales archaeon]MEB3799398.1 hypothetical protein [Desulfurococcales archaeon]MEB3845931.1 hypothetical protein [Desulfurococcales archaeon]